MAVTFNSGPVPGDFRGVEPTEAVGAGDDGVLGTSFRVVNVARRTVRMFLLDLI